MRPREFPHIEIPPNTDGMYYTKGVFWWMDVVGGMSIEEADRRMLERQADWDVDKERLREMNEDA